MSFDMLLVLCSISAVVVSSMLLSNRHILTNVYEDVYAYEDLPCRVTG